MPATQTEPCPSCGIPDGTHAPACTHRLQVAVTAFEELHASLYAQMEAAASTGGNAGELANRLVGVEAAMEVTQRAKELIAQLATATAQASRGETVLDEQAREIG
jgi:hypothetical protein